MFLATFPALALAAHCTVIASGPGRPAVVVDPGLGVADQVDQVCRDAGIDVAAVLVTHAHPDHVWSCAEVSRRHDAPVLVHPADAGRLADPLAGLEDLAGMFAGQLHVHPWQAPDRVELLPATTGTGGVVVEVAGMAVTVRHAPGHTEGSVLFEWSDVPAGLPENLDVRQTLLTGDVLFAGSIGRTDRAGADPAAMERTLREVVLALPDDTLVLPGHGPATTIGHERRSNPYLAVDG